MKPGLYRGLDRAEYDRIEAVNFSMLKFMEKSPVHFKHEREHPTAPTTAMEIGSIVHEAILEPKNFKENYAPGPDCSRRSAAGRAEWAACEAEHAGKRIIKPAEYNQCAAIRDAVWRHPLAPSFLNGASTEISMVWDREGTACKARLDALVKRGAWTWIVDVKTTSDARPAAFLNSVLRYGYHVQAAWYLDGLAAIAPHKRRFAWIVIEKQPPYALSIIEPCLLTLDCGRELAWKWLEIYRRCERENRWPDYGDELQTLTLPPWARKKVYDATEEDDAND